jgi:hypothetical protein
MQYDRENMSLSESFFRLEKAEELQKLQDVKHNKK